MVYHTLDTTAIANLRYTLYILGSTYACTYIRLKEMEVEVLDTLLLLTLFQ